MEDLEIDRLAHAPETGFLTQGVRAVAQYHLDLGPGDYVVKPFHPDLRHLSQVTNWSLMAACNGFVHHARSDIIASRILGLR